VDADKAQFESVTQAERGERSPPLSGGSSNFPFHLVFFPAASFISDEGFGVVVVVGWISAIEKGVVNLLPYPSLACGD
jgi:hypothetical protein